MEGGYLQEVTCRHLRKHLVFPAQIKSLLQVRGVTPPRDPITHQGNTPVLNTKNMRPSQATSSILVMTSGKSSIISTSRSCAVGANPKSAPRATRRQPGCCSTSTA